MKRTSLILRSGSRRHERRNFPYLERLESRALLAVATITGSSQVLVNTPYTLTLAADFPATSWSINWGDGSSVQTITGAPHTVTHLYQSAATVSITATATEANGTIVPATVSTGGTSLGALVSQVTLDDPEAAVVGPDGNLYVASANTNAVLRYDSATGELLGTFVAAGSGGLSGPRALAFGPRDGNLYIASYGTNSILEFDGHTGTPIGTFVAAGTGGLNGPVALTFDASGNLFVSSANSDQVLEFDSSGGSLGALPSSGSGLVQPQGLAFGPDGALYVANNLAAVNNGPLTINYPNFSSTSGLSLVGSASVVRKTNVLRLTPAQAQKAGAAWYTTEQPVASGFDTTFQFQLSGGSDGIAFVIQTAGTTALGSSGGGLGFDGLPANTLAVEYDTYQNPGEPSDSYISVQLGGADQSKSLGYWNTPTTNKLDNNQVHTTRIVYQSGTLTVFYDGQSVLTVAVNLGQDVGSTAYVGMTGATGGAAYQTQDILSWNLSTTPPPGGNVLRYSAGSFSTFVASNADAPLGPAGLAFGSDGTLYVGGSLGGDVRTYAGPGSTTPPTGTYLGTIIATGTDGLAGPTSLSFDMSTRRLLIGNRGGDNVLAFDPGTESVSVAATSNLAPNYPSGLAFNGGNLYVGSRADNSVLRYDANTGAYLSTVVSSGSGGLSEPTDVAYGPDGYLYVASRGSDQVLRYDGTTGAFSGVVAQGSPVRNPVGEAIGPDGALYVASTGTNQVLKFDATTGAFLGVFVNDSGLNNPQSLVFGPDANGDSVPDLYVCSGGTNEVRLYDGSTGAFLKVFASGNGLSFPTGLVFGPDGDLYVAGYSSNNVVQFNGTTGAFISTYVAAGSGGLNGPQTIVFGPDGNLYVDSFNTNQVLDYAGPVSATPGSSLGAFIAAGSGGLSAPEGMSFGPDGNLYVYSADQKHVLYYAGPNSTTATPGSSLGAFTAPGSGGLDSGQTLLFNPANQLWYVTSYNTSSVILYDATGSLNNILTAELGPFGLAFGPDNALYIGSFTTNRILRWEPSSGAISTLVQSGSGGLDYPTYLTFGPGGDLYVSSANNNHILRYDTSGNPLPSTGLTGAVFESGALVSSPAGLAFGPDDNLYVASNDTHLVDRFDGTTGAFLGAFVPAGSGGLSWPWGLAFGPDGSLDVVSDGTDTVQHYAGPLATSGVSAVPVTVLAATPVTAFNYPNFSSTSGLSLVGSTSVVRKTNALRLTPAQGGKAGAAWYTTEQPVASGFDTTFQFQLSGGSDGIAFVIQTAGTTALGSNGGGLGFDGLPANTLAVEYDTYQNGGEPSDSYISVQLGGADQSKSLGYWNTPTTNKLDNNQVHTTRIVYQPGTLTVYYDGAAVLTVALDLVGLDAGGLAYVGMTGATGGAAYQTQDILNWIFGPPAAPAAVNSSENVGAMMTTASTRGATTLAGSAVAAIGGPLALSRDGARLARQYSPAATVTNQLAGQTVNLFAGDLSTILIRPRRPRHLLVPPSWNLADAGS